MIVTSIMKEGAEAPIDYTASMIPIVWRSLE